MNQTEVKPAEGRLGILVVGCGAVATTFMTGVLMARKGLAKPIGSMTQYDRIRVGSGDSRQYLKYEDIVPLASLSDLVFGCWDVYPQNAYQAARYAEVLKEKDIEPVRDELGQIVPMRAAFDPNYAKRLAGDHVKTGLSRWQMVEALRDDIRRFKAEHDCARLVVLWAASTEIYVPVDASVHDHLADLEAAMKRDDRSRVAPSMCYAYAALSEGAPFIMGAPNTTVDIPAMWELAERMRMPIAGKDFKTGQTLVKSGFAPIISTRCLGLSGWFSTNILGNRDGLVLDEPENFHTKEVSKRKSQSSPPWRPSWMPIHNPSYIRTTTTRCASTTIRHVRIIRSRGTISTSSAGWAIPCRSRSTSSAATPSWQHRCVLISVCSSISQPVQGVMAFSAS